MTDANTIYDFERAILSSIIFDPSLVSTEKLRREDFSHPYHQSIYDAITTLKRANKPIEEGFIAQELKKAGKFDENVFLEILAATPIVNIEAYIDEIRTFSTNQRFNVESKKILSDDSLSVEEKIANLKQLEKTIQTGTSLPPPANTKRVAAETPHFYLRAKLPIQKNEITLITGKGGTGKSYVSIWLAATLAKEEKLRVFAYLSEDTLGNTKNRLDIIRGANPFLKDADFEYWGKEVRPSPFLKKTSEGFMPSRFWYHFTSHLKNYDIIILDPLIAFIAEDENSNVEARALFNLLNEWCDKDDKTIIIIHHHNKDDKIRGASAFVDAIRLHFILEKRKEVPQSRFLIVDKANHYTGANAFEIRLFKDTIIHKTEIVYEETDIVEGGGYEKF